MKVKEIRKQKSSLRRRSGKRGLQKANWGERAREDTLATRKVSAFSSTSKIHPVHCIYVIEQMAISMCT